MSIYGQFCPISRSAELLGERWTLLIVRELLMGSSRFNELQRGLSKISPTLLTKRLQELENANILFKKRITGQRGYEYFLTPSGLKLEPIVMELAKWGLNWIEDDLVDEELDLELLMLDISRNLKPEYLPNTLTTLKFYVDDAAKYKDWWLLMTPDNHDLCIKDPGKEPDAYVTTDTRTLTKIWMNQLDWKDALKNKGVVIMGDTQFKKQIPALIGFSPTSMLKGT